MPTQIFDPAVAQTIADAQAAARQARTKTVVIDGQPRTVRSPFPSPGDWRAHWIYVLLIDRFNNPAKPPNGTWNRRFDFRQGGTFTGVQAQLGYLEQLGAKALWLSPVLKNSKPNWPFNYHGYGQQDFLNVDERFASDGQRATAEHELTAIELPRSKLRGIKPPLADSHGPASLAGGYLCGMRTLEQPQLDVLAMQLRIAFFTALLALI